MQNIGMGAKARMAKNVVVGGGYISPAVKAHLAK